MAAQRTLIVQEVLGFFMSCVTWNRGDTNGKVSLVRWRDISSTSEPSFRYSSFIVLFSQSDSQSCSGRHFCWVRSQSQSGWVSNDTVAILAQALSLLEVSVGVSALLRAQSSYYSSRKKE